MKRKREEVEDVAVNNTNNNNAVDAKKGFEDQLWSLLEGQLNLMVQANKQIKEFLLEEIQREKEIENNALKRKANSRKSRSRSPVRKPKVEIIDDRRIVLASRRTPLSELKLKYGENIDIIDVSKFAGEPYSRFHPSFPLNNIGIPNTSSMYKAASVQGIYEALKKFEFEDISKNTMIISKMKGIIREANQKRGKLLGFQYGFPKGELISEEEAKDKIFLETYKKVLDNHPDLQEPIATLRAKLDDDPNLRLIIVDSKDPSTEDKKHISHAVLLRDYLEGKWPESLSTPSSSPS